MWKQRIITSLWWLLGICLCGLLTAGMQYKKHLPCSDIKVNIERVNGHVFIDENDIIQILKRNGAEIGKPISDIYLQPLESILKKQPWIFNAELFFDNNNVLNVSILEREPLARIFTTAGASFYIDSSGMQLPLSDDYAARVPMVTGFTSSKKKLSKPDSLLMVDIKSIAKTIQQDPFWNAQVAQVNITSGKTFEIIPTLGNQVIKLGNADSLQSKFDRLTAFYKQVWAKGAFEKYEGISVEFSGQIVAVKRGAPKPAVDIPQAQRFINAMRNSIDITDDTTTAHRAAAVLPAPRASAADSSVQVKKKIVAENINVKTDNSSRENKKTSAIKSNAKPKNKGAIKGKKK